MNERNLIFGNYTVKENIIVLNTSEIAAPLMHLLRGHMEWMATMQECGRLKGHERHVTIDGQVFHGEYADIAKAVEHAGSFTFRADYWCELCSTEDCEDITHISILKYLDENPSAMGSTGFYSACSFEDSTCGGKLWAYGHLNEKAYCGAITAHKVDYFPECGCWTTHMTAISYETEFTEGLDLEKIRKNCNALMQMSGDDTVTIEKNDITFFLNNLTIRSAEEFQNFIHLAEELNDLSHGESSYMLDFVDNKSCFGRVLSIDWDQNGKLQLMLTEI